MRKAALLPCMLGLASLAFWAGKAARPMRASPTPRHQASPASDSGKLTERNKLDIIRSVDGEFVRVVRPLPSIKPGFLLKPTGKFDKNALQSALIRSVPAANPGDTVQVTSVEFKKKSIRVNINGGSHPHESWRKRIHVSFGLPWPTSHVVRNQPPGLMKMGSTLIVEFGRQVPNITPAQLKKYLSPFIIFTGARSAAQVWADTLPPKFKKAIERHEAAVGMDRTMVLAAMGRPGHKIRSFKEDGTMTEDWIYGSPPGMTVFVTFIGNEVVRVKKYP